MCGLIKMVMEIKGTLMTLLLMYGMFYAKAQDRAELQKWPVPKNLPGLLFYIQRDPDINTVCYTVKLSYDGAVDLKNPIDIFWMRYSEDGKKKKLNTFQREFGYGLSFKAVTTDSILLTAVAFPNRPMHLVRNAQQNYVVKMKISEQTCELKRVYIRITGGSALSPDIDYIEFCGLNAKTRQWVSERIDLH